MTPSALYQMGLGKTLQTLSFLSALKEGGLSGPHLVVTPLAGDSTLFTVCTRLITDLNLVCSADQLDERDKTILSRAYVHQGQA